MHVKYKIFLSAMEYLPFSMEDDSKGSFEEIIERYSKVSKPCHFFLKILRAYMQTMLLPFCS